MVTGYNLVSLLKLLFYLSITANNSLLLKICCENIVDLTFLIYNLLITIYHLNNYKIMKILLLFKINKQI